MTTALEKELKHPDQFVTFSAKAGKAIGSRKNALIGGAIALLVVLGGLTVVRNVGEHRAEDVSRSLGRIERIANAALIPEKGEAPKGDEDLPHFKTEKERTEEALKAADAFIASNGSSPLVVVAKLSRARFLLNLGRAPEAQAAFQELRGSVDGRYAFLAEEGLAVAQADQGQLDAALKGYEALAESAKKAGGFFRDRALYARARLLEQKGAAADAEKAYKDLLAEFASTPLKEEINDRLAVLQSK